MDIGIIWHDDARECLLFDVDKLGSFLGISLSELGGQDGSDVFRGDAGNIELFESTLYTFDLSLLRPYSREI